MAAAKAKTLAATLVAAAMAAMIMATAEAYTPPSTLTYRLTLRDFLPSHCIGATNYTAWYDFYDSEGASNYVGMRDEMFVDYADAAIPDDWYATNIAEAMNLNLDTGPQGDTTMYNNVKVNHYCPYWTQGMSNGTIKGHPDFEAAASSKTSGRTTCYKGGQSQTCSQMTSVISPDFEFATSGLPKVVYCNDTYNSRCGQRGSKFTTSRQQFFYAWYNDDPVYNKRVGHKLELDRDESDGFYKYTSTSFFPLSKYDSTRDEGLYTDGPAVREENYEDPRRAPVWPNSMRDINKQHYWFTTEFHTYFEYSGNETFEFDGDDDFWVFINNRIAIDLGGTHSSEEDSITLSEYSSATYLNLTVGEIYPLSIFHAERHYSQSNFNVITSISESCNVARPGSSSVAFSLSDASDEAVTFSPGVSRDETTGITRLSSAEDTDSGVSTWLFTTQAQNVGAGFIATFTFQVLDEAAIEGLAFVATRRPQGLTDMPSSTGGGLGYRYLTHAVAVAIDMCSDRDSGDACEDQEVRIHYPDSPASSNADFVGTRRVYDGIQRSLRYDGEVHTVSIEYLQRPDWLEVYVDDSLYLRATDFDLEAVIGGRDAYIGLTSATGAVPGTLEILDFTLETISVEPSETIPKTLTSDAETLDVLGDGEDSAGFSIQTRDLCGNEVQNGGYADYMKAWYIPVRELDEDSRRLADADNETWAMYPDERVEATIEDNEDGSYTALLSSTDVGLYALYACFGPDCAYNWTTMEGLDSSSYYGHVDLAVRVMELTPSPTRSPVDYVAPATEDSKVLMYAAAGGGVAGFLFLTSMLFLVVLRRRWQRDKEFIEEGKLYNLDRAVEYDPNDEFNVVTRMVMQSSEELQRERARRAGVDGTSDITALETQNEQLQEEIRLAKQRKQLQASGRSRISRIFGRPGAGANKSRKQYDPESL